MTKRLGCLILAATTACLIGSTAQAEEGYGTAGCGLGSMLFGNEPGIVQVLAATTNGTFGSQTFGITTGTSNCVDSSGGLVSAKAFVEANREALAKDMSRGEGETISSLSSLAGCESPAAVGAALQSDFGRIFPDESVQDAQVSQAVVDTLVAHPELSCQHLS